MKRIRQLIGWAVVVIGAWILITQIRHVWRKKTALPDIRHPVFFEHDLYDQARANLSPAIATEIAPFYLIARELHGVELIVAHSLGGYTWDLENVGRTHVTVDDNLADASPETWIDLIPYATRTGQLATRKLYLFVEPGATRYVLFATTGDGPLYIMTEAAYRSRARSGANLSTP